jgi:hypothetical protein
MMVWARRDPQLMKIIVVGSERVVVEVDGGCSSGGLDWPELSNVAEAQLRKVQSLPDIES